MNKLAASSLLALALLTVASYGQKVIVIKFTPFFIRTPGRYILEGDLTASEPNFPCIVVEADDVDLNLNRFKVSGSHVTTAIGIRAEFVRDVRIRNGTISGFLNDISMQRCSTITLDGVLLYDSIETALVVDDCSRSSIEHCGMFTGTDTKNSSSGISINNGTGIQVADTTILGVRQPFKFGIIVAPASSGNYFNLDYVTNCETALKLQPEDKYRNITTRFCPNGIVGGIDVDGMSN